MRDYTLVVNKAEEGGFWGEIQELPGCFASGETLDELREDAYGAIETYIDASAEMGVAVPEAAGSLKIIERVESPGA